MYSIVEFFNIKIALYKLRYNFDSGTVGIYSRGKIFCFSVSKKPIAYYFLTFNVNA